MKKFFMALLVLVSVPVFAQSQNVECKISKKLIDQVSHSGKVLNGSLDLYDLKYKVMAEMSGAGTLKAPISTDLVFKYGTEARETKSHDESRNTLVEFKHRLIELGCTTFVDETGEMFNEQVDVKSIFLD